MFMNIEKYFQRLEIENFTKPDLTNLKHLHKNHLLNIPFENLDIHYNRKIILDFKLLEDKILNNNRGGFCYELNGLFYKLLSELGYNVKMICAGVYNNEGIPGPDYDHMALIVKINNEEYLADVGFGDNFLEPIKFELDTIQKDEAGFFKIVKHDEKYFELRRSSDGINFKGEYLFKDDEEKLEHFQEMCSYHQTSPESHFTQKRVCSKATDNGRITLSNLKFIKTENRNRTETELKNEKEFLETLKKYFGIVL